MDIPLSNLEHPSRYSMDRLEDEDGKEDATLLGRYKRDDKDRREGTTLERYVADE